MTLLENRVPFGVPARIRVAALPLVVVGLVGLPPASVAQNPPLPPPSQAQQALQQAVPQNPGLVDLIRQRLAQSGMTPDQVRARLQAAGYSPTLLDAYLGQASPSAALPLPGTQELAAIQALGLPPIAGPLLPTDTGLIRFRAASLRAEPRALGTYVFGVDVFARSNTQFLPPLSGR